jgi:DNA-binding CsgD family transcriptional regulator
VKVLEGFGGAPVQIRGRCRVAAARRGLALGEPHRSALADRRAIERALGLAKGLVRLVELPLLEVAMRLPKITQRERDVLRLLADGKSNEEIGKQLFISPETVRTHVRKAMAKLEADTRTEAVAKALRQRLIA